MPPLLGHKSGPLLPRQWNAVPMAFPWRADSGQRLSAGLVTNIHKKFLILLSTESQNEPVLNADIYRKLALFGRPYHIRPILDRYLFKGLHENIKICLWYWYHDVYVMITLIAYAKAILNGHAQLSTEAHLLCFMHVYRKALARLRGKTGPSDLSPVTFAIIIHISWSWLYRQANNARILYSIYGKISVFLRQTWIFAQG